MPGSPVYSKVQDHDKDTDLVALSHVLDGFSWSVTQDEAQRWIHLDSCGVYDRLASSIGHGDCHSSRDFSFRKEQIIHAFGAPRAIFSGNATCFSASPVNIFMSREVHLWTTVLAYAAISNGKAGRMVGTITESYSLNPVVKGRS